MKYLITGSGGFIASHVLETLRDRRIESIGLERHINHLEVQPDQLYFGDMRDKSLVEKVVSMSDGVINLAGILGTQETIDNPYPSVETNILGALNVFEACKIWKKPLVQISVGNHWMNNSYSITKLCAERFAQMYAKEHGVKVNIVRALNAFGERQKFAPVRKMMPYFITQALKNEDIGIYGDGLQEMDFIYVKDVAAILLEVLDNTRRGEYKPGQVFEAGNGEAPTVNEWAQKVIKLTGSTSKIVHNPMRPGEPANSRVISENPYPFITTKIDEALKKTIQWYTK